MSSTPPNHEKSLVIIKPDAVSRRLCGRILQRFEDAGFKLHAMHFEHPTLEKAAAHYSIHSGKPFFSPIVEYMASGPIVAIVFGGMGAVSRIRKMIGQADPSSCAPGTIRGDYSHEIMDQSGERAVQNVIHSSESVDEAEREIEVWFEPGVIVEYSALDD